VKHIETTGTTNGFRQRRFPEQGRDATPIGTSNTLAEMLDKLVDRHGIHRLLLGGPSNDRVLQNLLSKPCARAW